MLTKKLNYSVTNFVSTHGLSINGTKEMQMISIIIIIIIIIIKGHL